ncbi:MAG TPA: DoxX family protein [Ktedonobacterales bacterium]|nr:DoxX family protein [Ktedonobacterales bacterium]
MDFALLILRATTGSLVAGHGAQKLFGWFQGPGVQGTSSMMESLALRPGRAWALVAGASEFGGGVLTLLGFLNPVGPVGIMGAMGMATAKVHWGKPIWATSGGAELPVTYMSVAAAIATAGPGKYSLDYVLHTQLPRWTVLPGLALAAGGIALGIWSSNRQQQQAAATSEQQRAAQEALSM